MTDSQDLMNQQLRFVTTPEERKIIRDRINQIISNKVKENPDCFIKIESNPVTKSQMAIQMTFTKPLEKKSVFHTLNGTCFDKLVITQGVVNRPTPIDLKLNGEVNKWKNK